MDRLTKQQAIIVSAYTGYLICEFSDLHEYVEKILKRPVFTHEFATLRDQIKAASKAEFLELQPE